MADGKQEFGGHSARTDKPIARGWLAVGGLAAAIGATSCCVLPLALFALGISGAWISNVTALAPYHLYFVAAAVVLLSLGFFPGLPPAPGRLRRRRDLRPAGLDAPHQDSRSGRRPCSSPSPSHFPMSRRC